jgi:hypothetical protein
VVEINTSCIHYNILGGIFAMDVVAELKIVGIMSEELVEKIRNCIKANVELIFPNEVCLVEGLTVEVSLID